MNASVLKDSKRARRNQYTAPLDGTILEGLKKDSEPSEWTISETLSTGEATGDPRTVNYLKPFGSGTAAILPPLRKSAERRTN
ncbi:ANM_collapsed_G0031300.mRNA.1.CDS.1 [Saccharomyces cerevisiae]|nr:ANM_collapsed_G0031300.mRNA.1.CDS.1 [Saccharomyces cerevisiae]